MKHVIEWNKISYALIFFIFGLFIVPSLGFIIKANISSWYFWFLFPVFVGFLFLESKNLKSAFYSICVFIIIVLGSIIISIMLYDYSFDGRCYHQIAIFYLKNGWNPIYQNMSDLPSLKDFLIAEIWIENYNKAFEIIGSNFYALTHRLESGKAQNIILLFGVWIYGFYALKLYSDSWIKSILFSFLFVCSPIVMSQIWTNYLDGFLSMLFLLALLSILKIEKESKWIDFVMLGVALILMASVKLTGVAYGGIIGICYLFFCIFNRRNIKQILMTGVFSCVLIVGSNINPWITNLYKGEHIFYPLLGEKSIDIITPFTTKEFAQKNRVEQFFISIFAKTQNKNIDKENPTLKIPLTTDKSEEHLSVTDTRIGGFGFLFSGVIVFVFLVCLLSCKAIEKKSLKIFILFGIIVLATTFVNPAPWWARYVPQVWFLPLFALFFLIKRRIFIVIGFVLAFVNAIEAFCLSSGVTLIYSVLIRTIDSNVDGGEIIVQPLPDVEKSHIAKFEERGIKIVEDDKSDQEWDGFIKEILKQKCDITEEKMSPIIKLKKLWGCMQKSS